MADVVARRSLPLGRASRRVVAADRASAGTTSETEDQMEGRLLLDVVIGKSSTIFKLLAGEDKTLLIGRDTFLVLNLLLYVLDGV